VDITCVHTDSITKNSIDSTYNLTLINHLRPGGFYTMCLKTCNSLSKGILRTNSRHNTFSENHFGRVEGFAVQGIGERHKHLLTGPAHRDKTMGQVPVE
jgi:endonuclease III-like uncharacterized protein